MDRLVLLGAALVAGALAFGSEGLAQTPPTDSFEVKPVLLASSDDDTNDTLALQYELKGVLWSRAISGGASDGEDFEEPPAFGTLRVSYEGQGVVAASADDNPLNFLDLGVNFDGLYSTGFGTVSGGVFGRFESDQSFNTTQVVIGARGTYGKMGVLADNDFLAFDLGFGRVAPGDDVGRKTALGVTVLDDYDRVEFEALYMFPTGWPVIETVELNYRHYAEVDAPAAVRAADLATHELATIRLGLPQNLFVAYSSGKLPFDRQDDEIFEVGLSYKLQ